MPKPDKPIFNQQGGRGKLYGPTHGATYMGTYQMLDGKMDRRMFNCATNKDAIKAYTDWCADMDARILEEMEEKVRPKAKAQQPKEKPAYTEPFKKDEVKGADMATTADAKLDKIYVVMVVGGVAVAWCESFDKAVAVCDALTLGAKASASAATYDVVEVKKWTAWRWPSRFWMKASSKSPTQRAMCTSLRPRRVGVRSEKI